MRLLVIRHAAQGPPCAPDFEDSPLTAAGHEQAQRLARALRRYPLGRVVSSDMARALQTARPIASLLQVPLVIEPRLAEVALGELASWHTAAQAEWDRITARWSIGELTCACPGGESLADVVSRVGPVVTRLVAEARGADFAIVAHAVVNGVMLCTLCPSLRHLLGKDIGHSHTGIWELAGRAHAFAVRRRNDTSHLTG